VNEQQKRVARGKALFTVYLEMSETDDEAADLIADVLHWSHDAHDAGGEPKVTAAIFEQAWRHFIEEIDEEFDHDQAVLGALRAYDLDVEHWTQLGGGCHAVAIILRRESTERTFKGEGTGVMNASRYLMVTWDGEWVLCLYDENEAPDPMPELHDGIRLDTRGIGERELEKLAKKIAAAARAFA
jgi:hypothetical protein